MSSKQNEAPRPAEREPNELPPSMQPSMRGDKPLSRDEIMSRGEEAAALLTAPIFNEAYRAVMDNLWEAWTLSQSVEQRESLWLQVQSLADVTSLLMAHVNALQTQNLTEAEEAEQDLHRYEDEQGFH